MRGNGQAPAPPAVPAARHVTAWIIPPDGKLTDDDRTGLKQNRDCCAYLDVLAELARGLNDLIRHLPATAWRT